MKGTCLLSCAEVSVHIVADQLICVHEHLHVIRVFNEHMRARLVGQALFGLFSSLKPHK
jgi:hypothetical protein